MKILITGGAGFIGGYYPIEIKEANISNALKNFSLSGAPPHDPASPVRAYKKALPTTFLPSVKTLTKNIFLDFLLAQVFF